MTDAGRRVLWTCLALILTALGGTVLAVGTGLLAGTDPQAALLWSGLRRFWQDAGGWAPAAVLLLALLAVAVGWLLLQSQWRRPAADADADLVLRAVPGGRPTGPGWTRLRAGVLTDGLERDLIRCPPVRSARVTLLGAPPDPQVHIDLWVSETAPLPAVRDHVCAAVARFSETSGWQPARLDITARFTVTD
ncbi:hypothetical protein [Melissospora conviva]|uniref:hypothetical protein n=1 Tax=Melissospora conviva TaxID=3388432 RepID=UPI003C235198